MAQEQPATARGYFKRWFEMVVVDPMSDFQDPKQEWRRLCSELLGTFYLVIVAAGGEHSGSKAGQGALYTEAKRSEQP